MDQRALGELAERAAEIAERSDVTQIERAGLLKTLVHDAAREHRCAPWTITSMIAAEWDRLGIRRVPGQVAIQA